MTPTPAVLKALDQALTERDARILALEEENATLKRDNRNLADQCNALREGRPYADGSSKNP